MTREKPEPADMEYRTRSSELFEKMDGDPFDMSVESAFYYYNEIEDAGRSKGPKTRVFEEVKERYTPYDYYVFARLFTSETFAHPEKSLGVGKKTRLDGAGRSEWFEDMAEARGAREEEGNVVDAIRVKRSPEATSIVDPGDTLPLVALYRHANVLSRLTKDDEKAHEISLMMNKTKYPEIALKMVGGGPALYVYTDNIIDGVFDGRCKEAAELIDDAPMAAYECLADDETPRTSVEPHMKLGEMKAKSDYDSSNIYTIDESEWIGQTKYDGARLYLHHAGDGDWRAYLAGGRDVTEELPELRTGSITAELPEEAAILDCEVVPYDAETGEIKSFQHILKRTGREDGTSGIEDEIEARFKIFDLLYWKNTDVRHFKYSGRLKKLRDIFTPRHLARTGDDPEKVFEASLNAGHEGIVMKKIDHEYEVNTRADSWQKWKAEPEEVDCVIMGAKEGGGHAAGSLGALRIGLVLTETASEYIVAPVGSVGTGFTDADRDSLWELHETGQLVGRVAQVSFEELQFVSETDGFSLRFPSFDALRPEGTADDIRHAAELMDMMDELSLYLPDGEDPKHRSAGVAVPKFD